MVQGHAAATRAAEAALATATAAADRSLSEAIEGAKVDVPPPWGTIALTVPPGTSGGRKLRAAGMGVRHANGAKGDLIAEVQIVLPDMTDAAAREALLAAAKAAAATATSPRSQLRW
jgi:DnaJ-class molecular chaperone